ncbi:14822_t:CDS:2 [Cetraspora pellucida]|uniref:14822_t:CDS:1 n=1 Tax=Cetraspora pellucida TaxID=1433469 RepID=A0A9N9ATN2_9GLOM|nr:14822_t:CDS:2 [Cetraspora pellucida]
MASKILKFSGHNYFRQRLILAILSGKPVKIDKVRSNDSDPGLKDFEASFLRLLDKVTNGSIIEINYSGTSVLFKPGVITGGTISHDCGTARAIGYFLEPMIALAPFSKDPFNLIFFGITNDNVDTSVDIIRTAVMLQLKRFGIEEGLELKISKRGSPPLGGGEVNFKCPVVKSLKPMQFTDEGRIKRIRGIACCTRVSPQNANRMIDAARSDYEIYYRQIMTHLTCGTRGFDIVKPMSPTWKSNHICNRSPGFALSLVAESTTSALITAEQAANPGETPEDLGKRTAKLLLSEIRKGGCIGSSNQWLMLLLMVLSPEDVSKIRLGQLTAFTIQYLRDIRDFFDVTFKIKQDPESNTLLLTSVGVGYINYNKKTT